MESRISIDDMIRGKKVDFLGNEFKTPLGDLSLIKSDVETVSKEFGIHVLGSYSSPLFVFRDLFVDDSNNKQRLWDGIVEAHNCHKGYIIHPDSPNNKLRIVTKLGARVCAFVSGDLEIHLIIDNIMDRLYQLRYQRLKEMTRNTLVKLSTDNEALASRLRAAEDSILSVKGVGEKSVEIYEAERDILLEKISIKDRIIDKILSEELLPFVLKIDCNVFQLCDLLTWVLNTWYYHRVIDHHANRMYPYSIARPSDIPYKIKPNFDMMMIGNRRSGKYQRWGEYPEFTPDPTKLYINHEHMIGVRKRVHDFIEKYGAEAARYVPPLLNQHRLSIDQINGLETPDSVPIRHKLSNINMWCYDNDFEVVTGLVRPVFAILDPVYCDPCTGGNCKEAIELNKSTGYESTAKIKIMQISQAMVTELQLANSDRANSDLEWMRGLVETNPTRNA